MCSRNNDFDIRIQRCDLNFNQVYLGIFWRLHGMSACFQDLILWLDNA